MSDLAADYEALRHGVGAVETKRDVVSASGADATDFLQGQLSQDLATITLGDSAWSLLLQPQGKMDALLRLTRRGETDWLLDVHPGWGQRVLDRLNRFKLRTDCALELTEVRAVLLRGPQAPSVGASGALIAADVNWSGLAGRDLLGDNLELAATVPTCSAEALEAVRIEAGVAVMGAEIDDSTIPAEANVVDGAVSFTKGCFTGQELVARIDSRGSNTPRRLRGLVFDVAAAVPDLPATALSSAGKDIGRLTSVAMSPGHGAPVALAYLGRAIEPDESVTVAGRSATVRSLPMFAA